MNFCKRSYQPILHYLYTETIKRGGEISLHKHFKAAWKILKKVLLTILTFFQIEQTKKLFAIFL